MTIESRTSFVRLLAGDDLTIEEGATVRAEEFVELYGDWQGDGDGNPAPAGLRKARYPRAAGMTRMPVQAAGTPPMRVGEPAIPGIQAPHLLHPGQNPWKSTANSILCREMRYCFTTTSGTTSPTSRLSQT